MRQTAMVVAALIMSGCVSRQQSQAARAPAVPAPRVMTHADSAVERILNGTKPWPSIPASLDSLAKELKASQRKPD